MESIGGCLRTLPRDITLSFSVAFQLHICFLVFICIKCKKIKAKIARNLLTNMFSPMLYVSHKLQKEQTKGHNPYLNYETERSFIQNLT